MLVSPNVWPYGHANWVFVNLVYKENADLQCTQQSFSTWSWHVFTNSESTKLRIFFAKYFLFSFKVAAKCLFCGNKYTTKNILGIAHPKHSILLLVSRILEGNSGNFSLLVASNQIYFLQEMNFSNWAI